MDGHHDDDGFAHSWYFGIDKSRYPDPMDFMRFKESLSWWHGFRQSYSFPVSVGVSPFDRYSPSAFVRSAFSYRQNPKSLVGRPSQSP